MMPAASHRFVTLDANITGSTASAQISIAVFRAALTLHPRAMSDDEIQPPPMPPTSAMRYTRMTGGPIDFRSSPYRFEKKSGIQNRYSHHTGSVRNLPSANAHACGSGSRRRHGTETAASGGSLRI